MKSIWIFGFTINLIACIYAGPIEVVYSGDGCECPARLNYQVNVPKLPMPPKYVANNYGYKIDVPPIQAKAKVSYTFDFSVEEPKPPYPVPQEKLNLLAKVDRIALHKPDCPYTYIPPAPPAPAPALAPAPCSCSRCGISKPLYRYVNGKIVQPCRCGRPKCKCNLRRPNSITIGSPILVASGLLKPHNKNSIRSKRDLERIFFRPTRQELLRSTRYVKLYHKPISATTTATATQTDKENWLNMDFFSEMNPFKRKTKKVFFPDLRSRIVKRDIKGEYDLLEKERQDMDLTIPEIIQFMPETLQPNFKRGPCQFGCRKTFSDIESSPNDTEESNGNHDDAMMNGIATEDNSEPIDSKATESPTDDEKYNSMPTAATSFTKRNVNGRHYLADVPPILYNQYRARNPTNPQHISAAQLCEQRKLYAAMRRASETPQPIREHHNEPQYIEGVNGRFIVAPPTLVPDPIRPDTMPLKYTGDLDISQIGFNEQRLQDPTLGSPNYPVQHISSEVLDRIISDIIYRHPAFIEASTHYGGALVDPEPEQAEQTAEFIKKLIDGRLSLFFDEPHEAYIHYYPEPGYQSHVPNPYNGPKPFAYGPTIYKPQGL